VSLHDGRSELEPRYVQLPSLRHRCARRIGNTVTSCFLVGASSNVSSGRGPRRETQHREVVPSKVREAMTSSAQPGVNTPVVRRAAR
jgi:hypothetical protein